jgi:SAM-dependent methyltransferase
VDPHFEESATAAKSNEDSPMRWLIPPGEAGGHISFDAARYWDLRHGQLEYENVYSVTEDAKLRMRLVDLLRAVIQSDRPSKVLIPGCGSRACLERELVDSFSRLSILATDYPGVVEAAAARLRHPRVKFAARDTRRLGLDSDFDAAVVVNSVLSDCDPDNRSILRSVHAALNPKGLLVGLFPTIFAPTDIGLCEERERWRLELVDLSNSRYCFDEYARTTHILYTPLRLRTILREAGFDALSMEIFFCDSPCLRSEASRVYGLEGEDLVLYELLVTARKPRTVAPGRRVGFQNPAASADIRNPGQS